MAVCMSVCLCKYIDYRDMCMQNIYIHENHVFFLCKHRNGEITSRLMHAIGRNKA